MLIVIFDTYFCKDNAKERNESCFQIAECNLSSAKIQQKVENQ